MNVNKCILGGNLVRDPEVTQTNTGTSIAVFSLAVNEYRKAPDGQRIDEVSFVSIKCFGRIAEIAQQYLTKGTGCIVEARVKQERWKDQDGKNQSRTKFYADKLHFIDEKTGADDV